jgi:hypothetical protein
MLRYSLRGVFAAKGRLLLTAVAIVLGVGAVAGTLVLTDTVRVAAEAAYAEPVPRVDVVVRAGAAGEGEVFSDITGELFAQPMPASALEEVLAVDGVAAAAGVVSGDAHLLGRDGRVVGGGRAPLGRSVDPSFAKDLLDGRVPRGPGEVAIDGRTAREQRFGVGDRVRVVASGGEPATSTVAGILDSPELPDAVVLVGTIPPPPGGCSPRPGPGQLAGGPRRPRGRRRAAPRPCGRGPRPRLPDVHRGRAGRRARPQRHPDRRRRHPVLPRRRRGRTVRRHVPDPQHLRHHPGLPDPGAGLLRCVGASRAQLRRAVLLQAAIVGTLASLAGLAAGIGLASAFGALLRSSDEAIGGITGGTVVLPRTVAVALAVGVGTALVSAWGRSGRPRPGRPGPRPGRRSPGRGRAGARRRPCRPGRQRPAAGRHGRGRARRADPRPGAGLVAAAAAGRAHPPGRGRGRSARRRQRRPQPRPPLRDRAAAGRRAGAGRLPVHPGRRHQGVGRRRAGAHPGGRLPAGGGRRRHAPAAAEPAGGRAPGGPARAGRGGGLPGHRGQRGRPGRRPDRRRPRPPRAGPVPAGDRRRPGRPRRRRHRGQPGGRRGAGPGGRRPGDGPDTPRPAHPHRPGRL